MVEREQQMFEECELIIAIFYLYSYIQPLLGAVRVAQAD